MKDRQALHAYLSRQSHAAWQQYADQNGVSVTGIVEALGLILADEIKNANGMAYGIRQELVTAGRAIDAARRRRGGA